MDPCAPPALKERMWSTNVTEPAGVSKDPYSHPGAACLVDSRQRSAAPGFSSSLPSPFVKQYAQGCPPGLGLEQRAQGDMVVLAEDLCW